MPLSVPAPEELTRTSLALGEHTLHLWHVGDLDTFLTRMLRENGQVEDDDIPYYAWLWPTALVLAERVLSARSLSGLKAIELGCGTGLVGLCAALKGAQVTLTDLQEGALVLARRNAEELGVSDRVSVVKMDWRAPRTGPVDLLLCSDVLYEARFAEPLAEAIETLLDDDGVALMGDPSRPYFPRFVEALKSLGLHIDDGPTTDTGDGGLVRLSAIRRACGRLRAPWEAPCTTGATG